MSAEHDPKVVETIARATLVWLQVPSTTPEEEDRAEARHILDALAREGYEIRAQDSPNLRGNSDEIGAPGQVTGKRDHIKARLMNFGGFMSKGIYPELYIKRSDVLFLLDEELDPSPSTEETRAALDEYRGALQRPFPSRDEIWRGTAEPVPSTEENDNYIDFPRGYLPMDCPACGRHRLEYGVNSDGAVIYVKCEKCGANSKDETLLVPSTEEERDG